MGGRQTDDEQITGYTIYRNGSEISNTSLLHFTESDLSPETEYQYQVSAYDNTGLESVLSSTLTLVTSSLSTDTVYIQTVPDQVVNPGDVYQYTPTLVNANSVFWSKEYGPDDMTVDPETGTVNWAIPAQLPTESFPYWCEGNRPAG